MLVTRYTHKLRLNVIASQIAIACICISSPLVIINTTSAQSQSQTQINSHIQRLKNPQQRSAAIDYLATVGKPAVPALITALQDTDPQVRASALLIIAKIGPNAAQAIPALMRAIDDKDATVRSHAVQAIAKMGKQAYVPYIVVGLDSKNQQERYGAAHILRAMGKDAASAVPALMKKLEDKDAWMRVNVISALGSIGKAATPAVPALVTHLRDTDQTVRHSAAYALGDISSSWQENLQQLSIKELDTTISNLEKALQVLQNPSLQFRTEAITAVKDPLVILKKEKLRRAK
jgi:HEAT repeat protein